MITKAEAEELVMAELRKMETPDLPFAIATAATIEKPFGWVFFYNTRRFLETGEGIYQLAGNGPIIVNRDNGTLTHGRSNQSIESFIEEFEHSL